MKPSEWTTLLEGYNYLDPLCSLGADPKRGRVVITFSHYRTHVILSPAAAREWAGILADLADRAEKEYHP